MPSQSCHSDGMEDVIAVSKSRLARTLPVTALVLIVVFAVTACGSESSPSQSQPKASSSGTLTSNCEQLVGNRGLVARALALTYPDGVTSTNPDGNTDAFRLEVQDGLANIVFSGDKRLADPVGQLVDFLDDPPTYLRSKDLTAKVRRAAAEIRRTCDR